MTQNIKIPHRSPLIQCDLSNGFAHALHHILNLYKFGDEPTYERFAALKKARPEYFRKNSNEDHLYKIISNVKTYKDDTIPVKEKAGLTFIKRSAPITAEVTRTYFNGIVEELKVTMYYKDSNDVIIKHTITKFVATYCKWEEFCKKWLEEANLI